MIQYAQQIAYSNRETLQFTYDMAKKYKDSFGCYVECGVAAGAQVIVMRYGAPEKLIYAFDSFQGIPLPSKEDDQMPGVKMLTQYERDTLPEAGSQVLESSGATVVSQDSFLQHMKDSGAGVDNLTVVKGWFEETMPVNDVPAIAILRLDGDLFNSTMVCLNYLYPKVITGGIVIIDDWELEGSRNACKRYFKSINVSPDYKFVSNIAYFIK